MEMKRCRDCSQVKEIVLFPRAWDRPDGYDYSCRACHRVRRGTEYEIPSVDDLDAEITIDVLVDDAYAWEKTHPRDFKVRNAVARLRDLRRSNMAFTWQVSYQDNGVRDLLYLMWERRTMARLGNEDTIESVKQRLPTINDSTEDKRERRKIFGEIEF